MSHQHAWKLSMINIPFLVLVHEFWDRLFPQLWRFWVWAHMGCLWCLCLVVLSFAWFWLWQVLLIFFLLHLLWCSLFHEMLFSLVVLFGLQVQVLKKWFSSFVRQEQVECVQEIKNTIYFVHQNRWILKKIINSNCVLLLLKIIIDKRVTKKLPYQQKRGYKIVFVMYIWMSSICVFCDFYWFLL